MQVIPAIDMMNHQVVRLKQGRLDDATIYSDSVLKMAEQWIEQGATRLHLVDLNGAFEGKPVHFKEISAVTKKFPQIKIEVGGGIRDLATIQRYIDAGVHFCILGTVAVKNPDIVFKASEAFPQQIVLGVDAKNGMVATEGWDEASAVSALDLTSKFHDCAIESIIYTDIAKDGMLVGMNLEEITKMKACGFPVIASGGLTSLDDIRSLKKIGDLHGVIAGKAIYEDRFTVKEAIEALC
jgi:phosphoribosylformimino-5-aminoimidazole carboxamide ribotide isomerase